MRRFGLILAAGIGARFGAAEPKQYVALAGVPVLRRSIDALAAGVALEGLFVVLAPGDALYDRRVGALPGVQPLFCGGATRVESVANALAAIEAKVHGDDWMLVHDAARPCVDAVSLTRLVQEVADDEVGGLLALPVDDSIKRAADASPLRVARTEAREGLWRAQTPQMFRYALLRRALTRKFDAAPTDESQAVEALGLHPRLVLGSPRNIKITHADDLAFAEHLLAQAAASP